MLDQFIDLQLVVARTRLQEGIVREVFDEVARREHVSPFQGPPLGVLRQSALAAGEEMVRIPTPLTSVRLRRALPFAARVT
jgi:hypothetical protein